ncbi:MAG: glycosyltransferase family 9 protein [Chloroflexi bacterium]|nr:glycosyltransferase family 9 protein [Chloroflexota bacterium]
MTLSAERVLVLRPGAIGDTLVTLPALLALRRRFPRADIQLAGNAVALPLVSASGVVDRWLSFDSPQVTRLFAGAPAADDRFAGVDVAVAWCADPDGTLRRGFEQRGARQVVIARSRPALGRVVHVAQYLVETLDPLGIEPGDDLELLTIVPPREAAIQADGILAGLGLEGQPFLAVHPGSGSRAKNWPAERYADVLEAIRREQGLPSVVLAGPADDDVLARLAAHARGPLDVVAGQPLTVVAALLPRAYAFLGNDSGLAHLAGQLGVPTLALFGPTDPAVWSPLGPRVRTLRSEPLTDLPVRRVLAALAESLRETPAGCSDA